MMVVGAAAIDASFVFPSLCIVFELEHHAVICYLAVTLWRSTAKLLGPGTVDTDPAAYLPPLEALRSLLLAVVSPMLCCIVCAPFYSIISLHFKLVLIILILLFFCHCLLLLPID
uniref:Uncharacterized protein n=1 Tax=Trypanosoma congolense (strain IL3000) TaxID=1068625 RepID=G0ULG4_TRYCI|nr:hypothetical protein, unlikely [Trypanosoma congolense IL3000]